MKYKSIFVSDFHIGSPQCENAKILDFIRNLDCENLFLVGDIIDAEYIKNKGFKYWGEIENTIIQKILKLARRGTNVYFFNSNHFILSQMFLGIDLGNIHIVDDFIYQGIKDKIYIEHGHKNDSSIKIFGGLFMLLGNIGYDYLISTNLLYRRICKILNINPKHSLSSYVKNKSKNIIRYLKNFEETESRVAKELAVSTVIFGHTHQPGDKTIDSIRVLNCGAWTDGSCSYIIEDFEGNLKLKYY